MRICIIGPVFPYRGGIAHFTTLLAKKLTEAGHDVLVISFKRQYPALLYPGKSDKDTSLNRLKVPAEYLLTPINPFTWFKTITAILKFNPEKVIFQWWVTIWGPAFKIIMNAFRRSGIKTTTLIHNTTPHEGNFFGQMISRWTLKTANHYIVMTEKEKQRLQRLIPSAVNIDIVPLPIFKVFKATILSKGELRHQLKLPLNKP